MCPNCHENNLNQIKSNFEWGEKPVWNVSDSQTKVIDFLNFQRALQINKRV